MLRKIILSIPMIFGFLAIAFQPVFAQQTVMGQDNSAVDVQAVQTAVNQGGMIILKGAFDFGEKGRVNITRDVKIVGEQDDKGSPLTKIKGGFWTFHSPLPAQLPPEVPGPKITIQNIHFDGAFWAPIHLAYSSGATITNNKITNVQPVPSPAPIFGKTGLNRQQGIICTSLYVQLYLQPSKPPKYQPGACTGPLIITGNEIDLHNESPEKTQAQGVVVIWTTGVTAQILANTIYNCSRNSIEAVDNYLGEDGSGMILIKDNKIVTAQVGTPVPTPNTPNGIIAGWFLDIAGGSDKIRNPKYTIVNNSIRACGEASVGIAGFTDGVVIEANSVTTEGPSALPLFLVSGNGYIAHNKIEGKGTHGLTVRPWGPLKGSNNVFLGNNFKHFKASVADVIFEKGGNNNLIIGSSGTVSDLGSGNQIEGLKPVSK
jgi:hypothetical protein